MDEFAIITIPVGLLGGWLFRSLLLRALRLRHPSTFYSVLGAPTMKQLDDRGAALVPSRGRLQMRFLRYLWGGEFIALRDGWITFVGVGAVISHIAVVAGFVALAAR